MIDRDTSRGSIGGTASTAMQMWGRYQLRLAVGRVALGRPLAAITWARRAVDSLQRADLVDRHLAAAFGMLATCYRTLGQLDQAEVARRRQIGVLDVVAPSSVEWVDAVDRTRRPVPVPGTPPTTPRCCSASARRRPANPNLAPDAMLKARALNALGIEYKDTGRYDEAARTYGEALDLVTATAGPDHLSAASLWHNLAGLALARGHPDQAEPAAARAFESVNAQLGPDHHLVAQDLAVLGAVSSTRTASTEAEPLFQRALTIFRRGQPADHYEVAVNLSNLGICQLKRGDSASAEALLRRGLDIKKTVLGNDHPEIARQLNNLAVAVGHQQRTDEADDLHRQALAIARSTLGADHPLTRTCRHNALT